jgi:hypothetical protein
LSTILNWILKRVTFKLYNSNVAQGRRLGGHDIPGVDDSYIILELTIGGLIAFTGYFQTS